ncbi:MAG: methyl-accepting chemotaxis protein [Nocardioidaceae bacterium]|nr:methyl-accepting chemotaxis protein [Nocardioidaceae bacterium]
MRIGTDVAAREAPRWSELRRRFAVRLVAATLVVSLPLMTVLAVVLTRQSSSDLTAAAESKGQSTARSVTLHLEDWLSERQDQLTSIAVQAEDGSSNVSDGALLRDITASYPDYSLIEITDLSGKVSASSRSGASFAAAGQAWFQTARSGKPALTTLMRHGNTIQWILATPVLDHSGQPVGVVAADLNAARLVTLLNPELEGGTQLVAVDANKSLLYATSMGTVPTSSALLAAGALATKVDNVATQQALKTGEPGVARVTDQGRDVIGGYDLLDQCLPGGAAGCLGWVIFAETPASVVLAPVNHQRNRAILVVAIATALAILVSVGLAARTTRPIRRLTKGAQEAAGGDLSVRVEPSGSSELVTLGESFNAMLETSQRLVQRVTTAGVEVNSAAAELSASSDELAATTTQQSAAVTQATSTTEELSRASAAIAETVDDVATQTAETKDNLEQAESDIILSSERTLSLARRVDDIDALLTLINEIADQTNLLALNAAIEAARAGENGLGFAVVADEVRRLAERSKTSAGEINTIIAAVQGETNATVMAMEKGAKQMQRGLKLLEAVTDANDQVRMTTQQQRNATSQVVETMEQLADSSRQVAATAVQIASAAGDLADLAGNLETAAATATAGPRASNNGHG